VYCAPVQAASPSLLNSVERILQEGQPRAAQEGCRIRMGDEELELIQLEPYEPSPSTRTSDDRRSDWTPYAGAFGVTDAAHLLHRTVIGPRWDEIEDADATGLSGSINLLLAPRLPPVSPGDWATEPIPDITGWTPEMIDSLVTLYIDRGEMLKLWWTQVLIDQPTSLTETMTLFWHDHFATGLSKVFLPQSMYVQNVTLREYALGNVRELVRAVAYDPAMLIWLDGQQNRVDNINENFGRELLELFTLGVDQYSQEDVIAAARAFTGWVTEDGVTVTFVPEWHDDEYKEFLGHGGNWDGDDIIDFIFEEDETARFFCRKLYRYFIDEFPDEGLIEDLAQTLRAGDYAVLPVLERMFGSELFFDPEYRGAIIADGIDMNGALLRKLAITDPDLSDYLNPPAVWVRYTMGATGQMLFEPPNVAGWPAYRTWINSYTLPWRKALAVGLIDGHVTGYDIQMQADVMALAAGYSNPDDAGQLIDDVALDFFGLTPTDLVRQRMLDELLQGMSPEEWSMDLPKAEARIQDLLRLGMRLPDFHLK